MKSIILLLFCIHAIVVQAQDKQKSLREGNDFYRQKQFEKAAAAYEKAVQEDPSSSRAKFNLANTLQQLGKQEEALKAFTELTTTAKEKDIKAGAWYNKGVVLSQQKKLEESIEAYKNALRLKPDDTEARENLQKALLELKKKNPPKKEEKKDPKKQQQKKQQQPKMSPKEAEQRLKLLEQKEKELNQRMQKEKSKTGGNQAKDW
jgi:Ca-activated chloride channel homolog